VLTDSDEDKPEMTCGTEKDTPGNRATLAAGSRTRQLAAFTSLRPGDQSPSAQRPKHAPSGE
jgi:hypothetical protein